jgi:hypothetical protein
MWYIVHLPGIFFKPRRFGYAFRFLSSSQNTRKIINALPFTLSEEQLSRRGLTASSHLKKELQPISGKFWSERNSVSGEWSKISQHECGIFPSSLICCCSLVSYMFDVAVEIL